MSNPRFSNYVQSVAFQMTLSRNMIEAIGLVRDIGNVYEEGAPLKFPDNAVPVAKALERRGLIEHWATVHPEWQGPGWFNRIKFVYRLTRAGELMCDLLVEAELLHAAQKRKKGRKAA